METLKYNNKKKENSKKNANSQVIFILEYQTGLRTHYIPRGNP